MPGPTDDPCIGLVEEPLSFQGGAIVVSIFSSRWQHRSVSTVFKEPSGVRKRY